MADYIDINCDMGEGIGNEASLMPFVSSANIACGYHAGDTETILHTLELCREYGVAAGAHPSFRDRMNFGRVERDLPVTELYELVVQQLLIMQEMAEVAGVRLTHVKPHGALYNLSARDPLVAQVIAKAVRGFDSSLLLVGLSGSCSIGQAIELGLSTISEVYADRSYQDDGSLTPRNQPGALITDPAAGAAQVLEMVKTGMVSSLNGVRVPIVAESVCLHGDGPNAIAFAETVSATLKQNGIAIRAPRS
ncbi:MAG: LamB/YcsF family protein [Chitinophagaceae bacterium]|nr:LamB/YcsF family protein [Chitinophagaceae bacterium]